MAEAVSAATPSATAGAQRVRGARVLRAAVLLLSGFGIAFTATLHGVFEFDRWALIVSLALLGLATAAEYLALRSAPAAWLVAARALIAFAAAAALGVVADLAAAAIVVALWAALTALIAVTRMVLGAQPRSVGVPSALLSGALAVAVLMVRDDPVAVIGFFGAYAVIRGIFLGISAFDVRSADSGDASLAGPGASALAEADEFLRDTKARHD